MPQSEAERLAALRRYRVLDTAAEEQFDRLAHLAAFVSRAPIALVSLVDKDRQWFKSRVGLEATETPRAEAFCAHTITGPDLLVIPDTLADPRFSSNPLVVAGPRVRFYAGAPLVTPEGHAVGALSALDTVPRALDGGQAEALRSLAAQAVILLELRRHAAELARLAEALSAEVAERRRSEDLRAHEATHDALTGLANRALFLEHLRRQVAHAGRHPDYRFALLFADLDDFKGVNDRLGHAAGDAVLEAAARRIEGCVRPEDVAARFGGDEFTVLLSDVKEAGDAEPVARRINEEVGRPFAVGGGEVRISASVGVVIAGRECGRAEDCLREADRAMYEAKAAGGGRYAVSRGTG